MSVAPLLFLLLFLLGLSAVISASETSFFTLRPWRIERLRRERPGAG
jgi:CBS domain containing-hemolysin-like protein